MIIVMPDANSGRRSYFNDVKGDWNYEDFFSKELIPFVEKKYRTKTDKRSRAVAGLSMGGGTFVYVLNDPEMFSSACPLSTAVGSFSVEDTKKALTRNNSNVADSTVTNHFNRQSVLALVNNTPDDQKKAVRSYIDCGDDDFLFEGNVLMNIAMRKKEVPHEYRVRDGGNTWTY